MIPWGKWVELHREYRGISIARLAREAGVSLCTFYSWKRRQGDPSLGSMLRVFEAFGLEPWEGLLLMERADPEDYRPEEV